MFRVFTRKATLNNFRVVLKGCSKTKQIVSGGQSKINKPVCHQNNCVILLKNNISANAS